MPPACAGQSRPGKRSPPRLARNAQDKVGVCRRRRDEKDGGDRAGDFGLIFGRFGKEGDAVAHRVKLSKFPRESADPVRPRFRPRGKASRCAASSPIGRGPVCVAFPDAHRCEVRRLKASDMPLVDGVVGHPVESDLAVPVVRSAGAVGLGGHHPVPGWDSPPGRRAARHNV